MTASAVVSDLNPPEGGVVGGPTGEMEGGGKVDGPASALMCSDD